MKFRASSAGVANKKIKNNENSSQFEQNKFLPSYVFHKILTRLLEDTFCEKQRIKILTSYDQYN